MSYQSGPFGPGYTVPGGPPAPPGGGGPWGPPPGGPGGFGGGPGGFGGPGYPPPPPPKKSNTGLIIGIVVAVVFVIPMCAGIVIFAVGAFAAKSASEVGNDTPVVQPAQPAQPVQPAQPATPAPGANGPIAAPAGYRAIRGVGFSYVVPATWQDLNPADLGSPLIESAQRNPSPLGGFMTNVNIAGEAFSGDGPAYGAANLIELQKVATIRDQRLATSGSRSAWDIESFWPNSGGVPYVTVQRYVTNGWKGYVITCSAGSGVFSSQKATCDAVLSSFRVD